MLGDKPVSEIIKPNSGDDNGEYWWPWEALILGKEPIFVRDVVVV